MAAKLWEDIKKSAQETISYVTEKTEELTTAGKLKLEIASIRRKMENKFKELGKYVHEQVEAGNASALNDDEQVKALVAEISALEKELREKEEALEKLGKKEEKAGETEQSGPAREVPPQSEGEA